MEKSAATVKAGTLAGFILVCCLISALPLFAAPVTNADWTGMNNAGIVGTNGIVYAMTYYKGILYAGGRFTIAGNVVAANIAKWDGTNWSPLGSGITGVVNALVCDSSGTLYVGGTFASAGGVAVSNIAKWDGNTWSAIGSGVNRNVFTLVFDKSGTLYAGGAFDTSAGVAINRIAKWDGSSWTGVGLLVNGAVYALVFDNNGVLYAGGGFSKVGADSIRGIARWDGSKWDSLGSGIKGTVYGIATDLGGNVYAGGSFYVAGGYAVRDLAKWDGKEWGLYQSSGDEWALAIHYGNGDSYYISSINAIVNDTSSGLYFGGTSMDHVGTYDYAFYGEGGSTIWDMIVSTGDGGLYKGGVNTIAIGDSGKVYIGGAFENSVVSWKNTTWGTLGSKTPLVGTGYYDGLGEGLGLIRAIAVGKDGKAYVGGTFSSIGGVAVNNIAVWDNGAWTTVGNGMDYKVLALTVGPNGNLYAGGSFDNVSGISTRAVAQWNGSAWSAMQNGLFAIVNAFAWDRFGNLYAGGSIINSVGSPSDTLFYTRWSGFAWDTINTAIVSRFPVLNCLAVDRQRNVYAGGYFTKPGIDTMVNVAEWTNGAWNSLGVGIGNTVHAIAIGGNGDVFVGSGKDGNGRMPFSAGMGHWTGSAWDGTAMRCDSTVYALVFDNAGNLYAGGDFTSIGGVAANHLAKWNGSTWSALGDGTDSAVTVLGISDSILYVAGRFLRAGDKVSPNIASVNVHSNASNKIVYNCGPAVAARAGFRLVNSTIVFQNLAPHDRISLYSLSGRCIREAEGVSRIRLSGLAPQPLIVRVKRAGKIVSSGMVMGQ
jgi:hypothetical protein